MKKILLCLIMATQLCHAQFTGNYAPINFNRTLANFNGDSTLLTFNGSWCYPSSASIKIAQTGIISIHVKIISEPPRLSGNQHKDQSCRVADIHSTEQPITNGFYYSDNGTPFSLTNGDNTIPVNADDQVDFYTVTNSSSTNVVVTMSNFSFAYPLPLKLVNITGTNSNVYTNTLYWSTANELNTKLFEIERSTDGTTFSKVGSIAAAVNSVTGKTYYYNDAYNFLQGSTYFYRLKMIEQNMEYTYSPVVTISGKGTPAITVSPNPFTDNLVVAVSSYTAAMAKIVLTDINGRKILEQTKSIQAGTTTINLNLENTLLKGIYFMYVTNSNINTIVKLIKL